MNLRTKNPLISKTQFKTRRCCLDLVGPFLFDMMSQILDEIDSYKYEFLFDDGIPSHKPYLTKAKPIVDPTTRRGPHTSYFAHYPVLLIDVSAFEDRFVVSMADLTRRRWVYDTKVLHRASNRTGVTQRTVFLDALPDLPSVLCCRDIFKLTTKETDYKRFLAWLGLSEIPAALQVWDPTLILYQVDPFFADRYEEELLPYDRVHCFMLVYSFLGPYLGPQQGRFVRGISYFAPDGDRELGLELLDTPDEAALYNCSILQLMAMALVFLEDCLTNFPLPVLYNGYGPSVPLQIRGRFEHRFLSPTLVGPHLSPEWIRHRRMLRDRGMLAPRRLDL